MSERVDQQELRLENLSVAYQKIVALVEQAAKTSMPIHELERMLVPAVMKLGHAGLADFIAAAGNGDIGERATANGQVLKRSEKEQSRKYRSVFGDFTIERFVYALREKTRALLKPLDQKLGLPADEHSYVLEDWMANLSVDIPYSSIANWLEYTLGIDVKASAAHRRVEKMGGYVEEFNEQRESVPLEDEQAILVASADGKGVPIRTPFEQRALEELDIKPPKRPTLQKDYPKSKYRKVAGSRRTQRATAGAFYSIEANRRTAREVLNGESSDAKPSNKRLWAEMNLIGEEEVSRGAERVFDALAAEYRERDPEGNKTLICLMDGDRHLWSLRAEKLPKAIEILDIFHVIERLWKAAHCFHREASLEAEKWVQHHLEMLLENKVDSVRGLLKREINKKSLNKTKLKHLEEVYNFFTTNRLRMQYGDYIAAGYPIGSGVIEGTCKHVIGDRMCRSGMRWEFEGAQPLLDLRVTKLNDEWAEFIDYRIHAEQAQLYGAAA